LLKDSSGFAISEKKQFFERHLPDVAYFESDNSIHFYEVRLLKPTSHSCQITVRSIEL